MPRRFLSAAVVFTVLVVPARALLGQSASARMSPGQSCTIIYAADADTALAGNNEDWNDFFPKIRFVPGENGRFGGIYFGFDVTRYPQGGVNERGLFFDAAVAEEVKVPPDPKKTPYKGSLILKAMEECESVEQVLRLFEQVDSSGDWNGHYLVGDRFGNSAIIEPLAVIRKSGSFQLITNFLQSRTKPEHATCDRYRIASAILSGRQETTIGLLKRILNATHYENSGRGMIATQYSYICDLKRGRVHVYNFHNFQDEVVLDVAKELRRGGRCITLQSLFPSKSFAQIRYESERAQALLYEKAAEKKADDRDGFMTLFEGMKAQNALGLENERYDLSERQLLTVGARLAKERMTDQAIAVLALTSREFPRSAAVFEALADACLEAGRVDQAVLHYRKALELNPGSDGPRRKLAALKK
jgi:tetratricopeptide (TPR) repeat protein